MHSLTIVMALVAVAAAGPNNLLRRTTCSTPDGSGTCVNTDSCGGFSVPGYCPGPDDIQCCISKTCSTPSGSGTCKNTGNGCSGGSFIAGYCPGPDDIECCVKSSGDKNGVVYGFDVSAYQPDVDFSAAYKGGLRFVYIKATQGTDYLNPYFSKQYTDATNAGFIRGGYHFADGTGDGSQEAEYFLAHGGGWSADGRTLPGMLDLEGDCKSVDWIRTFSNTYHAKTGRYPTLYSSPSWWTECTGNSDAFVKTNALDMACWDPSPCAPQGHWPFYTFWQNADSNKYGGDSDQFNGDYAQLQAYAKG